jgi:hypothetical protein
VSLEINLGCVFVFALFFLIDGLSDEEALNERLEDMYGPSSAGLVLFLGVLVAVTSLIGLI